MEDSLTGGMPADPSAAETKEENIEGAHSAINVRCSASLSRSQRRSARGGASPSRAVVARCSSPTTAPCSRCSSTNPAAAAPLLGTQLQVSRRIRIIGLMCWGFTSMLMLRTVPAFAMQGEGGVEGMGDAFNFSNTVKGNIYAAWGWGYTFTQMPGGALSQIYGAKKTWVWFMGTAALTSLLIPIGARECSAAN